MRKSTHSKAKTTVPRRVVLCSVNRLVVEDGARPAEDRNERDELEPLVKLKFLALDGGVERLRLEEEDALEEEEDREGLERGVVREELFVCPAMANEEVSVVSEKRRSGEVRGALTPAGWS